MSRPVAVLLTALALLVPAAPALAQNPFGPLPPPEQTAVPTPEPTQSSGSQSDTGTQTLFVIAAVLLVVFVVIGVWIARDARRSVPEHHRGRHMIAEPERGLPGERRKDPKTKQQARKKARAQRQARKHNRPG
jgi:hypothetical protein